MKIAVYNRGIPFDGTTPSYQPLGGSESSIVYMARELARLGHDVTVVPPRSGSFGRGHAVMSDAAGVHYGASDPRADGAAIPEAPTAT